MKRFNMAGTYSQIYIHTVFAVKGRRSLILSEWEDDLYRYITGIVTNKEQKMLAINGMPDHIHFLIGMRPSCCLSDLVREIKKSSNAWINENKIPGGAFKWREGFGAFSCSHRGMPAVSNYIRDQKIHHQKETFREEYNRCLKDSEVLYQEEYLFEWIED